MKIDPAVKAYDALECEINRQKQDDQSADVSALMSAQEQLKIAVTKEAMSFARSTGQIERYFDFKEEKLTDLGLHADIFDADASTNGEATWLMSESTLRACDQFIEQELGEGPSTKHPEWFGLTTDDELKSIGHFETFDDADEACTFPTHWIFNDDSLRSFQVQINNVLEIAQKQPMEQPRG